jgi:RNase H-like domain found in reverse transcriptase/Reverse transcriptase (RNA-dependent DNA polymerase)
MPHLESQLASLAGSKYFATFDLVQGYWQLQLHPEAQECQSFTTLEGIFTPTRVLHGNSNSVAYLQSCMDAMLLPLADQMIVWLDDVLTHARSEEKLLATLRKFFELCGEHGFLLYAAKCDFLCLRVLWCGRILTAEVISFDPAHLAGLRNMSPPTTGAELQQFLCALSWVRTALPEFTKLTEPLHSKQTALKPVPLEACGWHAAAATAFDKCKQALSHCTILAHRDPSQRLCVFTDASDTSWSSLTSQVPAEDLELPFQEQGHSPFAFLSGRFRAEQLKWSIVDKKCYAIIQTTDRLDYLLRSPTGFALFTDHRNLVYIFDPMSRNPHISQHSAARLLRWALRLASYQYIIEHITGSDNVWADIMTRWAAPPPLACRRIRRLLVAPICTPDDFIWPSTSEIARVQQNSPIPAEFQRLEATGLVMTPASTIWIPDTALALQLRLCIVAHCGPAGHRSSSTSVASLSKVFNWAEL